MIRFSKVLKKVTETRSECAFFYEEELAEQKKFAEMAMQKNIR